MTNDELWTLWFEDDALDNYDDEKECDALKAEEILRQAIKEDT